jgi:stearoyl-CoA desaturase (delta-9 desaturase)
VWGYQNFDTQDDSRNNWLVGLVGNGEGWHNNHHAEPNCATHGRRWYELDVSYITIRGLELVGLCWEVIRPRIPLPTGAEPPPEPELAAVETPADSDNPKDAEGVQSAAEPENSPPVNR